MGELLMTFKKIFEWISNKHWIGNNPIPHLFCYLKHGFCMIQDAKGINIDQYHFNRLKLFGIVIKTWRIYD